MAGGQPFLRGVRPVVKENHIFKPIDPRLGVEGLPQSGTGQVTIFSGYNASKKLGRHFGPWPHSKTRYLLEKKSLFHDVQKKGGSCHFINAYPEIFFERARLKNRWSATTLMTRGAGLPLNRTEDVLSGEALTAEILQDVWHSRINVEIQEITTGEAAGRLLKKAKNHDLVLFEYYLTDNAGHEKDPEKAADVLIGSLALS